MLLNLENSHLHLTLAIACFFLATAQTASADNELSTDKSTAFGPADLAVIINELDPDSVSIGGYYVKRRNIPSENIIRVAFEPGRTNLPAEEFRELKEQVDEMTPDRVQGYALTWTAPYRVGCMSITSAFAAGYSKAFCAKGCEPTRLSPYFNSSSTRPYDDFGWRPTMAIAGKTVAEAKRLIDRGVASDNTSPSGTGYFVSTKDRNRNTRKQAYYDVIDKLGEHFEMHLVRGNVLHNKDDVFFYFTGMAKVGKLKTNLFRPGAMADHLTSAGGRLTDSKQMSSLRWLEAGATGSYGAVTEPCNYPQKFPHPGVAVFHYLSGATLIEAYWKSVAWPGQGIFIGEPLARPFTGMRP